VTWLVTGAGGFLGSHLVAALAADGVEVHGMVRTTTSTRTTQASSGVVYHECDIRDPARVAAVIATVRPTVVCHLAAQSSPSGSWTDVAGTLVTNTGGIVNVLDAIRAAAPDSLVLAVGSSAEYGPSIDPIPEDHPQQPGTPYGVSKFAQDLIVTLYGARYGLRAVRLRPFFVLGPRKTGDVASDLARRVVAVEEGRADAVTVGNLDAIRDLLDVRDAVAAFRLIATDADAGSAYNVCSGIGHPVRAVLDGMIAAASVPVVVRDDPALLRTGDEPIRVGDNARLRALGWSPLVSFQSMIGDVLDYWRRAPSLTQPL
jgi:GDP-4-dehydro-6-deoxy-D-mannose reductase